MEQKKEDNLKDIVSYSKEYGFIFPSGEIYEGTDALGAVYDYGPLGTELKNNIKQYWWKSMVQMHDNIVGIDSAIFMPATTWKASGHIDAFNDPLIDNKDSKKRYRADVLIEDYCEDLNKKIEKETQKAEKKFGTNFDKKLFLETNTKILEYKKRQEIITKRMAKSLEENNLADLKKLIEELEIVCPISGTKNWTDVRQFNLMFSTKVGSISEESSNLYLRPETAQGIFVNFLNILKTSRMKLPFGIAQVGKAFRNEIIARQFIFRMREFEQMEMQFFVKPGQEMEFYEYWKEQRLKWHKSLGLGDEKYRYKNHEKLAHYANAACDIEFEFPFGFKEIEGIHSRTDFDLKSHEKYSGKKLQYFDVEENRNYVPYVIETSIGLDRMFLSVLSSSLKEENLENGSKRTLLKIPYVLSPYKVAILPLIKKEGLDEIAKKIIHDIKFDFNVIYDEKDTIGKRYRRQDAIGTPFCITIDHDTLKDNSVTLRYRDSMKQERIQISGILEIVKKETSISKWLNTLE